MRKLTAKEKLYAEAYLQGKPPSECGKIAGYSPNYARNALTQNNTLKQYIEERLQKDPEPNKEVKLNIATTNEILDFLSNVMQGNIKDQFDIDASLQDRIKAANELLKFQAIIEKSKVEKERITIVNNIPRPK